MAVPVARKNLFADKVRLFIAVGGVTFAVLLILVVQSLYRGFEQQTGSFVEAVPADVWVMEQSSIDLFYTLVPDEKTGEILGVDGVAAGVPLYGRRITMFFDGGSADTYLVGFDVPEGIAPIPGLVVPGPGEIVVDTILAQKNGISVGDSIQVRDRTFTVSQVESVSNVIITQFSVISAEDAASLLDVPGNYDYLLVKVVPGNSPEEVADRIQREVPGVRALSSEEFAATQRDVVSETFLPVVAVLLLIAFLVGTAIVGLTIYTATIERTRDYGVMKAIGATSGHLFRLVIIQSVLICLVGFVLGVPLTMGVNTLANTLVPEFSNLLLPQDVAAVLVVALIMGVLASVIPIRRVASVDPASVFRT